MYQKSITHKLIRFQKSWFFSSNYIAKKRQTEVFMKVHQVKKLNCVSGNWCSSSPCRNGGTCHNQASGYRCTCPSAYTGSTCATREWNFQLIINLLVEMTFQQSHSNAFSTSRSAMTWNWGLGFFKALLTDFPFKLLENNFKYCIKKVSPTTWFDSKNIDFFHQTTLLKKTNRGFHESWPSQKDWIAFQETGVPAVHVETEAFAIIKLPVIGALVHLHTLDQHVQHVSEIFMWWSTCLSKWLFNNHILTPFPHCVVQ